ncbi:hypothetical protein NLX67_15260 [Domibacillus sp. A3M-37]|uniref:pLS20_p028 family conjugation system transmembrane protein n=1 Tax=Domibacillus sp. A3M-37 TaxID=2962037 RepID=UPI0020B836E1|nr:hypothetical protein [Domibacillus sp. A3M-37]MCP3763732.1 hypothetical protein [Domibacillus sp. A3M-37]
MNDEQVMDILRKFDGYLDKSDMVGDILRNIAWIFVLGLSWFVDALEDVANEMLLVKEFFQDESVIEFVETFQPLLYLLLAFSLIYAGYLLVFQRKVQAEAIAINFIIALSIVTLLSAAMDKMNSFTDEAIDTVNSGKLFETENGTVSEDILSRNINDLIKFDKNEWKDTTLKNDIPVDMLKNIKITEKFDSEKLEIDNDEVAKNYITFSGTEKELAEFDQGGLTDWNNEYYYRFAPDWFTILVTLCVMGFTLFSISYKLARLAFELIFNYILVTLVAPADLHDGQKTKKIIQSILNTFLVIILIFLSMKLYIIGTAYLADNFEGLVYIIALIGFSVALLDGPNMVERLFGIDAGLKGGLGLLAGTYAAGKMATNFAGGVGKLANKANGNGNDKGKSDDKGDGKNDSKDSDSDNSDTKNQNQSPLKNAEAKLPFDEQGTGKESPLKPSLDGSDQSESEQTDKNDIEANVDEKGKAAVSKSGETKGDSKDSDLQGALGAANGGTQSLEATSEQEQEVKQNQDVQQKSTGGQATLKGTGALDGAATPDLEQQMNGENAGQGNGSSISRQGLTEQPVNITDMQNGIQTAATSSQGGNIQQAIAPDQSLEQQAQPNITEGSTVQGGQNDVQRQSNAEQPVNITDVQNGTQTVTTSSQYGSVQQATAPDRSLEQQAQPSITEGSAIQGGQSDIQTQSNTTQQVNVTDTQNSEQSVNTNSQTGAQTVTTSSQSTTSSQDVSESPSSTGIPKVSSEERVISESASSSSTNQTMVQPENVNQVNEEVKVEENNRTITGSQSVSRVENGESGGGAAVAIAPAPAGVPKASSEEKIVENEGQDRQHVINRKSKKDRFNRMKNQTKK